jgi:Leucine-rich repeat (LRR) protein
MNGVAAIPILDRLTGLAVWRVPTATSLDALAGSSLESLDLLGCPVTDLEPVTALQSLKRLVLQHFPVVNLAPLASLPQLRELKLVDINEQVDLSPLAQTDHRLRVELWNTPTAGEPGPLVKVRRR